MDQDAELEFYLKHVYDELKKHVAGKFTGNICFKFNLKEGSLVNLNADYSRSVKYPHEVMV